MDDLTHMTFPSNCCHCDVAAMVPMVSEYITQPMCCFHQTVAFVAAMVALGRNGFRNTRLNPVFHQLFAVVVIVVAIVAT